MHRQLMLWTLLCLIFSDMVFPLRQMQASQYSSQRFGIVSLKMIIISFVFFFLNLAHYLSHSTESTTECVVLIVNRLKNGLLSFRDLGT